MNAYRLPKLRIVTLIAAAVLATSLASWTTSDADAAGVALQRVASGLHQPVYVTSPHDGSGRLFVVEKGGRIKIIKSGKVLATPFLDLSGEVSKGAEQGLLGLAFHPNFRSNGLFYVNYTRLNGDTVVARYRRSSTNPNVAIRSSKYAIITIAQPYANHNGGMITFGPDGYLYIGMGDGGSAGDPQNHAQNTNSLLGKILRINVNGSVGTRHYLIPSSNPYVGRTGRDEIWSRGLRNPWRFSFDHRTGDLWIGDVGQATYEEIDHSRVSGTSTSRGRGVNYGWRLMEGRHCYVAGCSWTGKVLPVTEYTHADGCAVTGGYVYRGPDIPALRGRYVFADYCSGKIWTISATATGFVRPQLLMDTSMSISSFGEGGVYELFVVDLAGGAIYRLRGA